MVDKYLSQTEFSSYEDMLANFKLNIPKHFNFAYDIVDEWAKVEPDKLALLWTNPEGFEKKISFAKMKEYSDRLANALTSHGIGKGDIVALILKRRWEFWPSIIACHKVGCQVIPINHLMKKKDLIYRFNTVQVKCVIAVNEQMLLDEIDLGESEFKYLKVKILADGEKEGWHNWNNLVNNASSDWKRPYLNENTDSMLLYYTSGTTGLPKVVSHNYIYPLAHIITAKFWLNCENNGLHLTTSDTGWAKSAWGKLYGQWICGSAVFVYDFDRFVAKEILQKISDYKITTFCAPPTIYRLLVKEDLTHYDFSNLKYTCTAGEALAPAIFNEFEEKTGLIIHEGFGQTECVCMMATFPWVEPKPGSLGKPSPTYNVTLVDDNYEPVDDGVEGRLVIDLGHIVNEDATARCEKFSDYPLGLFDGYIFERELDKEKFVGRYYDTGDVARRDENGYYWFVGRSDDIIKTSGYRVGPFEIENVLLQHPAVLECAITGVPDPIKGQVVKATIVLTKDYTPSEALIKRLQEFVKVNTAPYKYPRVIEFVEELPKTISNKIRRVDIRSKDHIEVPVIDSRKKNQLVEIGSRIKFLREEAGLSVKELLSKVKFQMSEEEYLRCEAGEIDMNVSIMDDIAEVFGVELSTLLVGSEPTLHMYSVTRKGKGFKQNRLKEYSYEALAYNFSKKNMEPFVVTVEPGNTEYILDNHPGREFEFVIEGTCKIQISGKEIVLEAGDSIFFDSSFPHGIIALNDKPCKLLAMIN